MSASHPAGEPVTEGMLSLLDEHHGDFRSLYAAGLAQRQCLASEDLGGVSASLAQSHILMDRIRLRRQRLPDDLATWRDAGVAERTAAIAETIRRIDELRRANETTARQLMERTRTELHRSRQGQRAARGYRGHTAVEARFFDGHR